MSLTEGDPTLLEKRHRAYVQFMSNILRGIAYYIEWVLRFVLYLALHLVDVLEALTGVLLQVFRVIKLLIKTLFTFGLLLRFIGQSFGAEGSFLFVLCLFTYFCFWRKDGSVVSAVSGVLHINVCVVAVRVWAMTIPIEGLLVFVRVRRKINQQIDLLVNYDKLCDKSTTGADGQGTITRKAFADKGTETEWTIPEPLEMEILSKEPLPSETASEHEDSLPNEGTGKDEDEEESLTGEKGSRGKKKKSAPILVTSQRRTRDKKS